MNRNTIIGFVLIAIVLIVFSWWTTPSQEQLAEQARQDSIFRAQAAQAQAAQVEAQEQAKAAKADSSATFFTAMNDDTRSDVVLENDKIALTLDTHGGTIKKAVVKGYKDRMDNPDVTLIGEGDHTMSFSLPANSRSEVISTADLSFTPSNLTPRTATLTATGANGEAITLNYELGDDYMLHFSLMTQGMEGLFNAGRKQLFVQWGDSCRQQEKGYAFENRYATLTYREYDGGTDNLNEGKGDARTTEESLSWVAFKTQFFSAVLIPRTPFEKGAYLASAQRPKGSGYLKYYLAEMNTEFVPGQPAEFEMYFGPNDFQLLKAVEKESRFGRDLSMESLVYLGWWLVRWINRWFTLYVFDGLTSLGLSMGIVLILITLLLKALTFPMVKKSYMSSAKMRVLKPKLEEATKQYDKPEDQMQKQQAMMQLYAKYGVSPLGGCLPMLIQAPIWIAMFFFVPNAIQLRGESFLWMQDLSTYDPIFEWAEPLWGIGDHLSLTCVLFCVANVLYSYMTMRQQRDQMVGQQAEQMKMMQWMMYLMPVMFFFIFNDYSSGLNFYYFISLFFSAAIMWLLRKTTNDEKLLAILERNYKENEKNPKKMGGLAARLQAMQQQQEELRKAREKLK